MIKEKLFLSMALSLASPFYPEGHLSEPLIIKVETPTMGTVKSLDELTHVYMLTYDAYLAMGYAQANISGLLIHYPYYDHIPETKILSASIGGKIIGSISYTADGPYGLTMEDDFKSIIRQERATGRRIAGVWRLVVDEAHRQDTRIVISLMRDVIQLLLFRKVDTFFLTVNPMHVPVYKRLFKMVVVGERRMVNPILTAPAVLMKGDPKNFPIRWFLTTAA